MKAINVLDLRDTYEIGGPGKTILETYQAIDSSRFHLHLGVFLTDRERGDTPFVTAARAVGMPVHEIRGANQYDPRMIWRVARLVRTLDIHIVHAHEVKSDVIAWLASALHPVRTLTTVHGWIANNRKGRFLVEVDKRVLPRFDRVIAVSDRIRDELLVAGVSPGRVRLLHNAIVADRYRRTGRKGVFASRIGRSPAGAVLSCVGRLSHEKGHADLIEALGLLAARGHRFELMLAGDGPERDGLVARVQALGLANHVHFLGYVSAPASVLEESDLMILPSHTEGLPNAALEALMMEVPVLATRVGGTPDVVKDGITGRLVAPHSPEALAAAIEDFLKDPSEWRRMAGQGQEMVQRDFNFATRTSKLEGIYTELVDGVAS